MQRFAQREGHRVDVNLHLVAHERVRVHFVPRVSPRRLERIRALRAHQLGVPVHLGREPLQALALVLRAHERDVKLLNQPVRDAHDGVARVFESARRLGGRRADGRPLLLRQVPALERALLQKRIHRNAPSRRRARHRLEKRVRLDGGGRVIAGVVSSRRRRHLRRRRDELVHEQKLAHLPERRRAVVLRERGHGSQQRAHVFFQSHRKKLEVLGDSVHDRIARGGDDGETAPAFV